MWLSVTVLCLCAFVAVQCDVPRGPLLGGWNVASENEESVKKIMPHAVRLLSGQINSVHHYRMAKLVSVRKKIVSGTMYEFVMLLQGTNCKKNDVQVNDINECDFDEESSTEECKVEMWYQPWISEEPKLHSSSCKTQPKKEKGGGGGFANLKFQDFMQKFNKTYPNETEYSRRLRIFAGNLKIIKLLNDHEQGTAKYGVTRFADLTNKEFRKRHLGLRPHLKLAETTHTLTSVEQTGPLPDSFDWRDKNVVSEVKNQGSCGSCWAFSVTGNVEGQWALKTKQLLSLSEQELVDCDKLDQGCNGGLMTNAYQQIMTLGGLENETDYPYEGEDEKCSFKKSSVQAYINGSLTLPANESAMQVWLVQNGPISIGINANAMQFYFGGVSHPPKFLCSPKDLNHGVLIVGYGVHTYPIFHKKMPFWIVKNSWGKSWGQQGYYLVYRGDGTCGLDQMATSSVVS